MSELTWWRGAVIYQVYPRSLLDTNGDGVGDLRGIITKLDYIASLNVDAIWISPFFKSPMADFGYDISDYREVDPLFGSMQDFDELIEKAHQRGIKVIIDQVLSHTSDQHAWFIESRENRTNPKADWYVWADPKEDGTAPNNWLAIFGGCAWEWEPRRQQYYLHNFLRSQPDINFHNPEVRQAVLDNVEFWLKKGVDGFRLDAITFCYHDEQLRDNPAKPKDKRQGRGFSEDNPYAYQYHYYNNDRPQTIQFIEELRQLINRYPGAVTLGEVSAEDSLAVMAAYTKGEDRLHMAYSFELLTDDYSATYIRQTVEALEGSIGDGWPCWAIGNHDVQRVASRWGRGKQIPDMVKMLNAMLCSLRGSVCSYQGEELGLTEAPIEFHELQDPFGKTFWPMFKGRDGCRTPMPWEQHADFAGFSQVTPWLPVTSEHRAQAVDVQEADPASMLHGYRQFLAWRKGYPILIEGEIEFLDAPEPLLVFVRKLGEQKLLVCFNLLDSETQLSLAGLKLQQELTGHGLKTAHLQGDNLIFSAYASFYALLV
ncbi:alpha-glucosidase [Shewanella xiamenensis]|uniref:alpha-glucosidase n=1 Tax=Shewanella xiamenensis TaxID=332186 RepID=UPI0024A66191|nr:alpha-glucosidase [Shewanella xiamenensis]MDI5837407.1 alpha-glucosidase family protein [Shewanella xiamenensis]MDI5840382.1 alpha-glucosidase family protein [Shewanella xiamenensis]MDI5844385.1 alpha-glucosidase family protein [Shewanella xiamenensis]MDI5848025.1 alpha-glucosidase family protein [Shewanella xiamenensis]MDI5852317.1 alpha-glucosidase family protein [Shewanella xiamenensis]